MTTIADPGAPRAAAAAVEQAAAFVRKVRIDFDQYLRLYAQSRRELLVQRALGGTQYPDSDRARSMPLVSESGIRMTRPTRHQGFDRVESPIWVISTDSGCRIANLVLASEMYSDLT